MSVLGIGWAIGDQLLVSLSRFALSLALARWASSEGYGACVVALAAISIVEIVQAAIITWPMAVIGAGKTPSALPSYVAAAARLQLGVCALCATSMLAIAISGAAGSSSAVVGALRAGSLAAFFVQLQEYWRRVLLTAGRPAAALLMDGVGAGLLCASLWLLRARIPDVFVDASVGLHALAASAAFAALAGTLLCRRMLGVRPDPARAVLIENWVFGRYILVSRSGEGLLSHALNFVVAGVGGAAAVATFDAPRLLAAPLQVASYGAMNQLLPRGAQILRECGRQALVSFTSRAALVGGLVFGAYAVVLGLWPAYWLWLAYGDRYQSRTLLLLWLACHVLTGIRVILSTVPYALRRSDLTMQMMLAAGTLTLLGALVLTPLDGLRGTLLARLVGEGALLAGMLLVGRRSPDHGHARESGA